mmetsp:Transcript_15053/g.13213  ORF Transcript_15053/g.13213 Transcript_15053/m.13213 type:complete len:93 (+) Transcript_15053:246-524(+)
MWSYACILCELYTGYPLFPCENEQELILYMQEYIGIPPKYLLEKSITKYKFYDEENQPLTLETHKGKITKPLSKTIQEFLKTEDLEFVDFIN